RARPRRRAARAARGLVRVVRQARGGREGLGAAVRRTRGSARPARRGAVRGGRRGLHLGGVRLSPARPLPSPTLPPRALILGSPGSIGVQALDIVARSGELELIGLSAERSWEALVQQARAHGVKRIALVDEDAAARAAEAWTDGEVLHGAEGLVRL